MTSEVQKFFDEVQGAIDERYLFGQRALLQYCLVAYLARGHVLIEGPPGTAKTMTARMLAQVLSKSFHRIQFTSDLLPGDILGSHVFHPGDQSFRFVHGPIFADVILADEINRTPPRTQSAMLEAMEERQVTIEGTTHPLDPDFMVLATQNPQDFEGTFPLPEAQMDRFIFKLVVRHADSEVESKIIEGIINGTLPPQYESFPKIAFNRLSLDREINEVRVDPSITRHIARILFEVRQHPLFQRGSSVRGGIALARAARILALSKGRNFVVPDDIVELAVPTLQHRVRLTPEAQVAETTEESALKEVLREVPFPS